MEQSAIKGGRGDRTALKRVPSPARLTPEAERPESLSLVLEGLLESLADGVVALDFRGDLVHISDCLRDPGYDPLESDRDPLPPEILGMLRHQARAISAGEAERFELDWEREELGPRRYRVVSALAPSGIALFAFHDITHEQALAKELEQSRNLAALGQMAATIAHELRNPLAAIQGFTSLLQRDVSDRPVSLRQIDRILEGVDRANHIINDLLAYSKPIELRRQATSMEAILAESLVHQRSSARWNDRFAADLSVDPGLPALAIDRRVMLQVLGNLYDNALDAMGELGTLSVRARASSDLKPCPRVRIVVRDTGCGLSAEEAARVFEPFYTTKPRGTGLGLALVRRAVEAHGGKVHVVSAPGRGTSVVIDLPVTGVGRARDARTAQEAA